MSGHPFLPDLEAPLVLASASPRRADILRAQGLEFTVQPADVEEVWREGESPVEFARRLAAEKAEAVAAHHPRAVVLGCDTVVVLGQEILGKPTDATDAVAMLRRLAGTDHVVVSAVALCYPPLGWLEHDHQETRVWFRGLEAAAIEDYAATGEPLDKAGAYGIQGVGAMLVDRIDGGYFNVMGLPLQALRRVWTRLHDRRRVTAGSARPGGSR